MEGKKQKKITKNNQKIKSGTWDTFQRSRLILTTHGSGEGFCVIQNKPCQQNWTSCVTHSISFFNQKQYKKLQFKSNSEGLFT